MSVSQANIGTLYDPHFNNIAWSQPGGKNSQVFPAQARNAPFTAFPVSGMFIDEVGQSLWLFGCGHGADVVRVFMDFATDTRMNCAVITCPICTFIQNLISPYEDAIISPAMTLKYPVLLP